MARPSKAKAIERLQKALDAIPDLKQRPHDSPAFTKWHRDTEIAITNTFGQKSRHIIDFKKVDYGEWAFERNRQRYYWKGLEQATAVLESMIHEIEEFGLEADQTPATSEVRKTGQISKNRVFLIHGRNEGAKQTVARFLESLDLKPMILHERPDGGRTIIEKFEQHADVGFAVALLTPDDVGALKGDESNLKPRARQNVIFEFGYFIGKLGRKRVCALVKGDVEKPSDYDGVLYIPLDDSGGWKTGLIRELKHAEFEVDANKAFET